MSWGLNVYSGASRVLIDPTYRYPLFKQLYTVALRNDYGEQYIYPPDMNVDKTFIWVDIIRDDGAAYFPLTAFHKVDWAKNRIWLMGVGPTDSKYVVYIKVFEI